MQEIIKQIVGQLNASVVVLLGILGASYYAVVVVTRLVEKFRHHETKLEKIDSMNGQVVELKAASTHHGTKLDKIDGLSERLATLGGKVDLIYQNTLRNPLTAAASPISITHNGQQVAKKINAEAIFAKYAARLEALVAESGATNAYDIQKSSMAVAREKMMNLLDAGEINTIKEEAFQRGVLVEDTMNIFGVYLRDAILEKRGIAVAEVDQHPPA